MSDRCPKCLGENGNHNMLHTRYPQGGGGYNHRCPLGECVICGDTDHSTAEHSTPLDAIPDQGLLT